MGTVFIGTSGWVYNHWYEVFYPEDLPSIERLSFYAKHFTTVELNSSFYHLPKAQTFQNWYRETPEQFRFALKASRYITHFKKLVDCRESWQRFIGNAHYLKEKLGPILFQLPPTLKVNIVQVEKFFKALPNNYSYALEARHQDWYQGAVYQLLRKYRIAFCIADSSRYPSENIVTSSFVYLRFHGPGGLYASRYSDAALQRWAKKIKQWTKQGLDVYAYFNNDAEGYAVENAQTLKEFL